MRQCAGLRSSAPRGAMGQGWHGTSDNCARRRHVTQASRGLHTVTSQRITGQFPDVRDPAETPQGRANLTGVIMFVRSAGPCLTLCFGLAVLAAAAAPVRAQTLLSEVHTIAAPTTAVPVEETFSVTTAGSYTIILTDLGAELTPPAPLTSVKLAVTNSSNALVGSVLVGQGTLTLAALPKDTYQIHVVGMPGNTPGSGPIAIQVDGPGSTQIAAFEETLTLPSQALPNGEAVLDSSFSVDSTGSYTLTLTDLQLPQPLSTLSLLLIAQGGGAPVTTLSAAGTATVTLSTGVTYDLFAVGAATGSAQAGLFSAVITPSGGGAVVFGRAVPVGNTSLVGSPALAAGSATLTLADLKYPAPLLQLESVATLSGQAVTQLAAAGSSAFTASSGTYSVFAYAGAATQAPGAGSYALQLVQGSRTALSVGRAALAPGSSESVYAFDTNIATAGSYSLSLTDFQIPAALSTLRLGVVQGGALAGTPLSAAGSSGVTAVSGPLSIFVIANAPAAGGLFGIDLSPASGGTSVFETTQAVGTLFSVQQVVISDAGSYAVTASDLGFPAPFANFDTIVTQGTTLVGSVYGGGTFNFSATPGTYYLNFVAQPSGSDAAGTYALTVAVAPPPPVVTLSVDNPQVSSGSTVDLTWSSQNATSCAASGGWSGTQAVSGTATSAPLTSNTTFTLTCTGTGGSTSKSVMVTVTAGSSGGGGGMVDLELLALLGGACGLRMLRGEHALRAQRP